MSLRTKVDIQIAIGFDASLDDTAFERAVSETIDTTEHTEGGTITLAALATDVQVAFGNVASARLVYIEAAGDITYRVNSPSGEVRQLKRMVAPTSTQAPNLKAYALMTEVCTALYLTNPSTTDAVKVKVSITGDLT